MPVDSNHSAQFRRSARRAANDEDIDLRRARGEISCAECRRLKLKCDKQLPCSSCVRRGCSSICPNGSLSTGQGTRFVLADTTQLHTKIAEMGQRIRELEDALMVLQASVSTERHPLLRDELLVIKFSPNKSAPTKHDSPRARSIDSIDALGTLTIDDRGEARYFGRSAGSETLLRAGAQMDSIDSVGDELPMVPVEVSRLSDAFPFGVEESGEAILDILLNHLPPQTRAWSLCETYLEHVAWTFRPLKRDEVLEDVLLPIYRANKDREANPDAFTVSPHKLGVLFVIFAIGALLDLTLEADNAESESYYLLSRAALSLRSIFDSPEVATVQAVALMSSYHGMGGKRFTLDSSWSLLSLAATLAQSIGLHRDSARWNLDPKVVQRRRALFWELFSAEQLACLAVGRPPSLSLSYVDCEFPDDDSTTVGPDGEILIGFHRWKYEYMKDTFSTVTTQTLAADTPPYHTVLDLDQKLREKPLPAHLNFFMSTDQQDFTPSAYMRGCVLGQYRLFGLLYIHRSFFVQAMLDHPNDPLKSPYAPSFLASYRCASGLINLIVSHFDRLHEICYRWWNIWTYLFSASIVVGTVVTRLPSSSMAPTAFVELGLGCDLFEKGAMQSPRARSGFTILCRLRERALRAYSQFRSGGRASTLPSKIDNGDDELALFGGQTRVLVSKSSTNKNSNRIAASPSVSTPGLMSPREKAHDSESPSLDVKSDWSNHLAPLSPFGQHSPSIIDSGPPPATPACSMEPSANRSTDRERVQNPLGQHCPLPQWQSVPSHGASPFPDYSNQSYAPHEHTGDPLSFVATNHNPEFGATPRNEEFQPSDNLMELMMMSGDSRVDGQWMSFMYEAGLLEGSGSTSH